MKGIRRALVLGLVLMAGTAIEHVQMQHHHGLDKVFVHDCKEYMFFLLI